jgi:hypothetical protein
LLASNPNVDFSKSRPPTSPKGRNDDNALSVAPSIKIASVLVAASLVCVFAIVDLIGSSSGQIRSCVSSVSEVGVALGTIIEEVREISWHVTAAIVAAQEQ